MKDQKLYLSYSVLQFQPLDIFQKHARSKEATTQVDLAYLEYLLPRLTRQWTHLERQRGGAGFMGGPGETQIEADRRLINDRINKLKKELKELIRLMVKSPPPSCAGSHLKEREDFIHTLRDAEQFSMLPQSTMMVMQPRMGGKRKKTT